MAPHFARLLSVAWSLLLSVLMSVITPAYGQRFSVGISGSRIIDTNLDDAKAQYGILLKPQFRVSNGGHLGLTLGFYGTSTPDDAIVSPNGALQIGSLTLIALNYQYVVPTQVRVKPYLEFGLGTSITSQRAFTDPTTSGARFLADTDVSPFTISLGVGVLFKLSEWVQLDVGTGIRPTLLEKRALAYWPVSLGLRIGKL